MGTISDKLTYLNTTKGLIKDTINLTGAGITNDTFRSYANKLKLGLINALNDNGDTIYSNLEKVSGKGSNLSLTPTYEAPMRNREIYGNTLQNGTPTPSSPVPIQSVTGLQNVEICGKNLLPNNWVSGSISGSTGLPVGYSARMYTQNPIKLNGNTTYCLKHNNTSTWNIRLAVDEYDINHTHLGRIGGINGSVNGEFTTQQNTAYINITVIESTDTITYSIYQVLLSNGKLCPMLNKGSTPLPYEPYNGNTYEVNLGKNLATDNFNDSTNGTPLYKTIESGTQIYISSNVSSSIDRLYAYLDNTFAGNIYISYSNGKITYSGSPSFKFNRLRCPSGITCTESLLSLGQATSYSPYFTPIELNKIGDYKDSIKKSTGKNLCNGINQEVWLNTAVDKCGISTGDTGLYIKVNGGNYTISTTTTQTRYRVACSTNEPSSTQQTVYNGVNRDNTNNSITIDTTGYNYLIVNATDLSTIQIEQNSQATSYEPFGKIWYITENIGEVVLNGTESDSTYNTGTTGSFTRFGYLPFMNTDVCKIQSDYVSNYFKYLGTIGGDTTEAGISNTSVSGLNRLFIFLPTSTASTIAQFKTWLSTHNTEIKYIKATPTYTVITNTELINQLESLYNAKSKNGTTNINVTSEDLSMLLNVGVLKGE